MQMNAVNMLNSFQKNWNIDMRVGNGNRLSHLRANTAETNTGTVFGAQCKVTISHEGRKLSEQMKAAEPKRFTAAGTERLLLRQQKQDEMSRSEQSDTLSEISGLMSSIRNSYAAGEDKETITNKQDALNRLLDLKARQEEENKQRAEEAEGSAAGVSKNQEEIDRKNEDLYLLLKTLEEQEEDEDEGVKGAGAENDTNDAKEERQGSVEDQFEKSASMLGVSAAKRELEAKGIIDGMFGDGYGKLAKADEMMHEIQAEFDLAAESLGKANLSEDEKNQLMFEHIERANNMMMSNYGEMMDLRRKGYQEIQDAKELELRHIAVNPLDGVERAKQSILDAGAAAALHEVSQGALDKASEELEERVQEAIDQRNDVVSGSEADEEQERAEEIAEEKEAEKLEEKESEQKELEKNANLMN